jgi:hypothetical protein
VPASLPPLSTLTSVPEFPLHRLTCLHHLLPEPHVRTLHPRHQILPHPDAIVEACVAVGKAFSPTDGRPAKDEAGVQPSVQRAAVVADVVEVGCIFHGQEAGVSGVLRVEGSHAVEPALVIVMASEECDSCACEPRGVLETGRQIEELLAVLATQKIAGDV